MRIRYIAYYRVSTKKQEYGLEAQKEDVINFTTSNNGELVGEFSEKESGKNSNRIELNKAILQCIKHKAILLIARLDRLSRDITFIFSLKESLEKHYLQFKALDLPDFNTLTLGIFATVAQHEREIISKRVKAGLKIAKQKGVKLGNPKLDDKNFRKKHIQNMHEIGLKIRREQSKENNKQTIAQAQSLRKSGLSLAKIASQLNSLGYKSPRGSIITPNTVRIFFKV